MNKTIKLLRFFSTIQKSFLLFFASITIALPTAAAAWPERAVTIVVPFSAGGATDIVARLVGQKLSEKWNQSVVIDNKVGAGGNVGTAIVARAKSDGYTLLMASGANLTINPHLYEKLPFDAEKDFEPITNVAIGPMVVATSTHIKPKTLEALIADARANPDMYNIGSAGVGSQGHLAGENFQHHANIKLMHVPYRGEAAAYADLMAGQIDIVVGNIGPAIGMMNSGRLNVLAVTSKEATDLMPNTPTAHDGGAPGFENHGWFGLAAPADTSPEIINKIYADVQSVLMLDDVNKQLTELGMAGLANTPSEFKQQISTESAQWKTLIKERNITLD